MVRCEGRQVVSPAQLAMQLNSPLLRGLDGDARLSLHLTDPARHDMLSTGERALLHIAANLRSVESLTPLVDNDLQRDIAGTCSFVSARIITAVAS